MQLYSVFLLVAATAVASPGPGVVMTLSNAMRYGLVGSLTGIFGIACGGSIVAAFSATSLGVLLANSPLAFAAIKWIGAAYLVWLGIRLWRAPSFRFDAETATATSFRRRWAEALSLQLTNPKAIVFFLAVFPQFIDADAAFAPQFALLVLTYGLLVLLIHGAYALLATRAKSWLTTDRGSRIANRSAACMFVCFGAALATAKR